MAFRISLAQCWRSALLATVLSFASPVAAGTLHSTYLDPAAIALQRVEIISVAQIPGQIFEDRPIAIAAFGADLAFKESLEINGDAIVVEQRVVHVNEEHKIWLRHEIPRE